MHRPRTSLRANVPYLVVETSVVVTNIDNSFQGCSQLDDQTKSAWFKVTMSCGFLRFETKIETKYVREKRVTTPRERYQVIFLKG